jgi:LacI family transcriptional regulator
MSEPVKPRAHATLRDVAAIAGVSPAAVSRYLNGSIVLPNQTAEKIDEAVVRLRYQPNPHARRLSRGRSDMIALVVPDIANAFFAQLAASVEEAAAERGQGVVLCVTANRKDREIEYIERLARNYVDALLFITNHPDDGELAAAIANAGRVVVLDEDIATSRVPKIFCDNETGGAMAARLFLDAGHRRFALIGGPRGLMSSRERAAGFGRALEASGAIFEKTERFGDYSVAAGAAAMEAILEMDSPPTALFSCSDLLTLGALKVLRARKWKVPQDLSLVTFDDVGPFDFFDPPITAVRQDVNGMGRRAVEIAFAEPQADVFETIRLPVELVKRASVIAPRDRSLFHP